MSVDYALMTYSTADKECGTAAVVYTFTSRLHCRRCLCYCVSL